MLLEIGLLKKIKTKTKKQNKNKNKTKQKPKKNFYDKRCNMLL